MRVLAAVGYFGRFGETDGVITTYNNLVPLFEESRVELDILCYGPEDSIERLSDHVRVLTHRARVPVPIDPMRSIDPAIFVGPTIAEISKTRYDVVQSSAPDPTGLVALSVARRNNLPLISIFHTALDLYAEHRLSGTIGKVPARAVRQLMYNWIVWYYNQADLVLAPSESVRHSLECTLKPAICTLSRGINTDQFHPRFRRRSDHRVRILYVGRVVPEKNLKWLESAVKDRDDIDVTVVGEGEYLPTIRRNLPRAHCTGTLTGSALSQAYASADIFAFPSRTDTLGNVVLEAMASGLPVVVSDAMGPKELVDDRKTGLIAGSEQEFADAINTLISDDTLRASMSREALQQVRTRTWQSVFERLESYYELVIDVHDRGRLRDLRRTHRSGAAYHPAQVSPSAGVSA